MKTIEEKEVESLTGSQNIFLPRNAIICAFVSCNGLKLIYQYNPSVMPDEEFILELRASFDLVNESYEYIGTAVHEGSLLHGFLSEPLH